jgi:hypothetical protein
MSSLETLVQTNGEITNLMTTIRRRNVLCMKKLRPRGKGGRMRRGLKEIEGWYVNKIPGDA